MVPKVSNINKNTESVLFADDTNIFVKGKTKMLEYKNANEMFFKLYVYMPFNKLHINMLMWSLLMSKCCYIDFKTTKSNIELDSVDYDRNIHNTVIKQVSETKFLGATIDENLYWNTHINTLSKKISCSGAILNAIKVLKTTFQVNSTKTYTIHFLRVTFFMVLPFEEENQITKLNLCLNSRNNV